MVASSNNTPAYGIPKPISEVLAVWAIVERAKAQIDVTARSRHAQCFGKSRGRVWEVFKGVEGIGQVVRVILYGPKIADVGF